MYRRVANASRFSQHVWGVRYYVILLIGLCTTCARIKLYWTPNQVLHRLLVFYLYLTRGRWTSTCNITDPTHWNVAILPVVTKDLSFSPQLSRYDFLSQCEFSTLLTTRQPIMVKFHYRRSHTFRYQRNYTISFFHKNRTHDFCTTSVYVCTVIAYYSKVRMNRVKCQSCLWSTDQGKWTFPCPWLPTRPLERRRLVYSIYLITGTRLKGLTIHVIVDSLLIENWKVSLSNSLFRDSRKSINRISFIGGGFVPLHLQTSCAVRLLSRMVLSHLVGIHGSIYGSSR